MFAETAIALKRSFYALLIWLALMPLSAAAQPAEVSDKRVLIIYGTGGIATWEQNWNAFFLEELITSTGVRVDPEFLSLVQTSNTDQELYAQSLQLKYRDTDFDLVLAVLPEANRFLSNWRHLFAPTADVIYVLPDDTVARMAADFENAAVLYTAVEVALEKTIPLIPSLLPSLERIFVVGGSGVGDKFYLDHTREMLSAIDTDFEVVYIAGLTPDELLTEFSLARVGDAILMTTYDLDRTGMIQRTLMVTKKLSDNLNIPIFSFVDTLPPMGSIGGNMGVTESYALKAAQLARDALFGNFPDGPVTIDTRYIFNGGKLDQFGVDRDLLPIDSIIVNDTTDLWREYYLQIIAAFTTIAFLLVLVALLINAIRMRKSAEQALIKANKKEALGNLASGIAHDFNNILMSISANTELASHHSSDPLINKKLSNILAASNRARNLVKQILMFSRPPLQEEVKVIELREHLEHIITELQPLFGAIHTIDYNPASEPLYLSADATQLHQIIMNICINAQHAMPGGGKLTIAASRVTFDRANVLGNQKVPAGDYIQVDFKDTGVGISADDLNHVFEPFFTTKPVGEGTGLGLALVASMVKQHNAYIDIQSKLNQGTHIAIYFPAQCSAISNIASDADNRLETGNGETVLFVEDDDMVRESTQRLLERLDYIVITCASPIAALIQFEAHRKNIDVVLTDFSMPELNGAQLIAKLRETAPAIPALLYSGYLNAVGETKIENCQILQKPIDSLELSQALRSALV
jgi:signal transduction histidine kinase/CheY-like chemotaxis protein